MRSYYIPVLAGALLAVSAFLPWILLGEIEIGGVPDPAGLWILGLGITAVLLAGLSIWTRKNSRHPLLVVGLAAFGIMFLGYQWLSRSVAEQAWARTQALAIVGDAAAQKLPNPSVGLGVYVGLAASVVLVLFGLTIVIKRVPQPYAASQDDDI